MPMSSSGNDDLSRARGWYSRGYLPHMDQPGLVQSISFRLHDALPAHILDGWRDELHWRQGLSAADPVAVTLRRRIARYEDAGHGACWLRDERLATIVEDALLFFDGARYRLIAWSIMPNHVHVLVEMTTGSPLARVLQAWKWFTARQANELLTRRGPFWARDYYDRFIRDPEHLTRAIAYIEGNPVRAGLAETVDAWWFGSARRRGEHDPH
jgi:putative transposase